MNFNWKVVFIGGVVYYLVQFVVAMVTGPILHQGILLESYQATSQFWRPELNQVPPDMVALMPRWITSGLIGSVMAAAVYSWVRPALSGAPWMRGVKFGVISILFVTGIMLAWSGIFNLPEHIWGWWWVEAVGYYLVGGAALGWIAQKLDPVQA